MNTELDPIITRKLDDFKDCEEEKFFVDYNVTKHLSIELFR